MDRVSTVIRNRYVILFSLHAARVNIQTIVWTLRYTLLISLSALLSVVLYFFLYSLMLSHHLRHGPISYIRNVEGFSTASCGSSLSVSKPIAVVGIPIISIFVSFLSATLLTRSSLVLHMIHASLHISVMLSMLTSSTR